MMTPRQLHPADYLVLLKEAEREEWGEKKERNQF
jgi:hypothetical protein